VTTAARFAGRSCVVTGGGRGIGRAIAIALAAEGAQVAVVSRTASQCEAVAAELGEGGHAVPADVSSPEHCERAIATVTARTGAPTVVINAAGISPVRGRAERHEPEVFKQIVDVNITGVFNVCRAVALSLGDQGAAIVNVASTLGTTSSPRLAAYGASKAGVIQLTRTLAREWAPRGIRVNAVCPGFVETEMTAAMLAADHIREEILLNTPLGRLGRLEEVVAPALFLASDDASYITGAALLVDGGMAA
jgi:NAD(P)-dependent dehydrogenase (short-subunit alcohol dehydrogenase family)